MDIQKEKEKLNKLEAEFKKIKAALDWAKARGLKKINLKEIRKKIEK